MADIPQIIPNNHPDSLWAKKVNEGVDENDSVSSPDFLLKKSGKGSSLTVKRKLKYTSEGFHFADPTSTEFDPDAAVDANEVIQVMPGTVYTDKDGNDVDADSGVWVCIKSIPENSDYWTSVPVQYQSRYKRQDGVNYYPKWNGGDQTDYWRCIGSLPCG
jgi:hypothetical protein